METKSKFIIGQRYGNLILIKNIGIYRKYFNFLCKCDCGNELQITSNALSKNKYLMCKVCLKIKLNKYNFNVNDKFGKWTIIDKVKNKNRYLCKCLCGHEKIVDSSHLYLGITKQCHKCSGKQRIDLTNKHFGKLIVLGYSHSKNGHTMWKVICECGNIVIKSYDLLTKGYSQYCNECKKKDFVINKYVFGRNNINLSLYNKYNSKHPLYKTWVKMLYRCYIPHDPKYLSYGGRGIKVCKKWRLSFDEFVKDMIEKPSLKYSLERINNDKGYYKENCRWATSAEQGLNKRNNVIFYINNHKITLSELSKKLSVNYSTLYSYLIKHSIEDALKFYNHIDTDGN
jgi:hypothetical protein